MASRVADILAQLGQAKADEAARSGQLWGNVIAQAGQIPNQIQANQYAQREQQFRIQQQGLQAAELGQRLQLQQSQLQDIQDARRDQTLTAQLVSQHSTTDPETGHLVTDHDAVMQGLMSAGRSSAAERYIDFADKNQKAMNAIQNDFLDHERRKSQWRADTLGAIANAPPEQRPGMYATVMGSLSPLAKNDPVLGKLPGDYPGDQAFESTYNTTLTDAQRLERHTKAAETAFKEAETKKALAEAGKAEMETAQGPKLGTPEEQYLRALTNGDTATAQRVLTSIRMTAQAKQDPAQAALARELAGLRVEEAKQRLAGGDQNKLEQQYRTVLARGLSSRSGGLGLEDAKVQQANHLLALLDQTYDPKSGHYNIPQVLQGELAAGLARLVAPGGNVGIEMMREFNQRTAKGDFAGALSYITGTPFPTATQDVAKMLRDSIERQGTVAEQNREGEMRYLRGLAPTELEETRRQKLEETSLNPLRQSRVIENKKTGERKIQVSLDGGKTWQ